MLIFLITILFQADEDTIYNLRDFRLPDAGAMKLEIDAGISGTGRRSFSEDTAFLSKSSGGHLGSRSGIKWDLEFFGEERFFDVVISSSLWGYWDSYTVEEHTDTFDSTKNSYGYNLSGHIDLGSDGGWYFKDSPWFLGWDADLDLRRWVYYYSNEYYYDEPVDINMLDLDGLCFLGVGIGKIRGVTSIVHAWDFLEEMEIAYRQNIEALADVLATRWAYELKYWRYEKYFYSDVEDALVNIGAVPRLTPYQVMRLDELINNLKARRTYGIRCFVGLGGRFSAFDSIPVEPGVIVDIVAGYPISRRWQTYAWSEGSFWYKDLDYLTYHGFYGGSVYYYLGERWRMGSSVLSEIYLGDMSWMDEWELRPQMWLSPFSLSYYLNERLTIDGGVSYYLSTYRSESYSSQWHNLYVDFDLTWRLR